MATPTPTGSRLNSPFRILTVALFLVIVGFPQSSRVFGQAVLARVSPDDLKGLSLEELMDLEVTSVSKQPEPYGEAPAAIQVLTGDMIRRSGATNVPEALRLADNLHVAKKGSHNWSISARGFNTDSANKLLVLMDGRSVYTPLFSGVFWDAQDHLLEDLDRIEVVSGPGGTLWGANAVNGVINLITKSARDTQGLYAEVGRGTELYGLAGLRYGGELASNVHYRFWGKYADRDGEVFPDGSPAPDAWWMGRGGFRLDADASSSDILTVQGDYYEGREGISTGGESRTQGYNLLGRWSHVLSEHSGMSLQAYYDRTYLRIPVPANTFAPAGSLSDGLDTYDLDFQHHFRLDAAKRLTWGLGWRFTRDRVGNAPGLAFEPAELDQHLFSGFVQEEIQCSETVAFTLGTKVEHNDYTGLEAEPSARLQWQAASDHLLWTAVSRAIRAPSRIDRDVRLPTPLFAPLVENLLVGGADFKSETVLAYEMGWRGSPASWVSSSLSLFYNEYDRVRSTSLSPPDGFGLTFPLFYANDLEGHTYGVEWTADFQAAEGWRLHAGYTFFEGHLGIKSGGQDFNNALNETADPRHRVSLRSSHDLAPGLEFDAAFRWVDSFIYNDVGVPATVPDYAELDLRLAWRPDANLEVSVTGQNLLRERHLEYVIASPNPREEILRGVYGRIACRL